MVVRKMSPQERTRAKLPVMLALQEERNLDISPSISIAVSLSMWNRYKNRLLLLARQVTKEPIGCLKAADRVER